MALVNKNQKLKRSAMNPFGLKRKDLTGELEGFPLGVVVRMIEEQEIQGNKPDVTVFQQDTSSDQNQCGFTWIVTEDGFEWWQRIIAYRDFNLFFEEYPEYKRY